MVAYKVIVYITTLCGVITSCSGQNITTSSVKCTFPDFVQNAAQNSMKKPWITQRSWQLDGYTSKDEITIHVGSGVLDVRKHSSGGQRITVEFLYNRTCLKRERDNVYRVMHSVHGRKPRYTCMEFINRSKGLIQIKQAPLDEKNEEKLCNEDNLFRDPSPWHTDDTTKATGICPLSGGFSFIAKDKVCTDWNPTKIELECIKGEGMLFEFPSAGCNMLHPRTTKTEERLHCFSGWEEDGYTFLVMYTLGEKPQFTLRLPSPVEKSEQESRDGTFDAYLYHGVIASTHISGQEPPATDKSFELEMFRTDSSLCYDSSPKHCPTYANLNHCGDADKKKYCKKSCKLCDSAPKDEPQCQFMDSYRGEWHQHDTGNQAHISINMTHAMFDNLNVSFLCLYQKDKMHKYTTISVFENGCRPRYSCLEFDQPGKNKDILRYRLSPSTSADEPILKQQCNFRDDQTPLKDTIRSNAFKNLISMSSNLSFVPCDIGARIPFAVKLPHNKECHGNVSGQNPYDCQDPSHGLWVTMEDCHDQLSPKTVYQCVAKFTLKTDTILLTQDTKSKEFNCWILSSSTGNLNWQYRLLHKLPSTRCNVETVNAILNDNVAASTYFLYDNKMETNCTELPPPRKHVKSDSVNLKLSYYLIFLTVNALILMSQS